MATRSTHLPTPTSERHGPRLNRLTAASLDYLTRNLDGFNPWDEGRLRGARVKAFAEFAVLYGCLEQWRGGPLARYLPLSESLPAWRAFIIQHCEDQAYLEMCRKNPPQAYYFLLPYLMLRLTGHRDVNYEETLTFLRRWGYPEATEVVPYRLFDRQYFLWKAGCLGREPNWGWLYRRTFLGRNRSLVYIDDDAAYSITHTLFYLTDFGDRPAPLTATEVERITRIVQCLLIHYWRLGRWDVMGELLINLNCLNRHESQFYAGAARAFQNAWRSDGAVPADRSAEKGLQSARKADRPAEAFRLCYHTTLVGVLYCATLLNRA